MDSPTDTFAKIFLLAVIGAVSSSLALGSCMPLLAAGVALWVLLCIVNRMEEQ